MFRLYCIFIASALLIPTFSAAGFHRSKRLKPENMVSKIINGTAVALGEIPYQAQILFNGNHFCGGSIIAPLFVVTTSGCLKDGTVQSYTVRAGHISRLNPEQSAQTLDVAEFIFHDQDKDDDVALIKLAQPFVFNQFISSITLPSQGCALGTTVNEPLRTSGWGKSEQGTFSPDLVQAFEKVVSQTKCKTIWNNNNNFEVTSSMICAGNHDGQGGCNGDAGNPLVTTKAPLILVGTATFNMCNTTVVPDLYIRMQTLSDWIKQNAQILMP